MKYLTLSILLIWASLSNASVLLELSKEDQEKLLKGEMIHKTHKIQDAPWPKSQIYLKLKVTPLEAIAVFAAYKKQKDYTPGVIESRILKHESAINVHVAYTHHMPFPFSNTHYSTENIIAKYPAGYTLKWNQLSSEATKETRGNVIFEEYNGETIFKYETFIYPKSIFARLLRSYALKNLKKTIIAITSHIQNYVANKDPELPKLKNLITNALDGKYVYKK